MINETDRREVLRLSQDGRGTRRIARLLKISRTTVQRILDQGEPRPRPIQRAYSLRDHLAQIQVLYTTCRRNLARVAEELSHEIGHEVSYSTLTRFCRRHRIGQPQEDPTPVGTYEFGPGVEAQHDTSPIRINVGGKTRVYQAASMKMGHSRARFLMFYRRFRRLHCRHFIVRSLGFLGGVPGRVVIDNTCVVIASGTGARAIAAPEMAALATQLGFTWLAHEKGYADRKAKVERDFWYIQTNFVKGRTFQDDDDLNRQALEWCIKANARAHRRTGLRPDEQLVLERAHLRGLPEFIPDPYEVHPCRRVDVYGNVSLHSNLYSAPASHIGRTVTVRETIDDVVLLDGAIEVATHRRIPEDSRSVSRLAAHRRTWPKRGQTGLTAAPQEIWLRASSSALTTYVEGLRARGGRRYPYQIRKLYALCHDYGVIAVEPAVTRALTYGLLDVDRLEAMLLQEKGAALFSLRDRDPSDPAPGSVTPLAITVTKDRIDNPAADGDLTAEGEQDGQG